ncbi:hypothetical protein EJB05_13040, partial [Eragrostis curvula]
MAPPPALMDDLIGEILLCSLEIFSAAVLCLTDSCNHLDCHGGSFVVVFAGTGDDDVSWVTGAWSASITVDFSASYNVGSDPYIDTRQSLITGQAVYFIIEPGNSILKEGPSVIDAPDLYNNSNIIMTAEDGSLGFAGVMDSNLYLWSWKADSKAIAGWEQLLITQDPATLLSLPNGALVSPCGFMEGTDTIFISTSVSIFTLKLKSGQIRK